MMMLDDLIVSVLLLAFVGVIAAIRVKARAQRANTVTAPPRARKRAVKDGSVRAHGRGVLEAA